MRGMNRVTLIGNLGAEPEKRVLEGGVSVVKLSVATSESFKDEQGARISHTEWHTVILWRGLADMAEKYMHKGSLVCVEGKIRARSYEDKNGEKRVAYEIVADSVIMLDKPNG
jgi:single-strand DNA-binding protein